MEKKNLFLLCQSYPNKNGEFFIDDELKIYHKKFEKIYILNENFTQICKERFVPQNVEILRINYTFDRNKYKVIFNFRFFTIFFLELWIAVFKYGIKPSFLLIKIMLADLIYAFNKKEQITELTKNYKLNIASTIFYSYWHDKNALSLALLSKKNKKITTIARAHRWDVYFEANEFPYLPYKYFILKNLSKTYCISLSAMNYFQDLFPKLTKKFILSRLGKSNYYIPLSNKINTTYLFCSCSNLIPVKRVELIIELISKINLNNIKWVHFGDGPLRSELEQLSQKLIPNIDYKFLGARSNKEILDFYKTEYIDLFINLSASEGIPVSIMEAQSAGIPVLATDVGGNSEIVNSENGFKVGKEFSMEEVVSLVTYYLSEPETKKQQKRNASFENWKQQYNAEINYLEFSNNLLNDIIIKSI